MKRLLIAFAATAIAGGAFAQGAPVVAPDTAAPKEIKDAGKARLEVSGKIQLDYIYDFKRVDPTWKSTLRPSTIPVNCPGDAGCGKDGESIFSVRQSAITFKGFVPTELGEVKTELSLDLFNVGGANTAFRLLQAWAELGRWGAGQYYSLFMNLDTFPNTIDYWGPSGMSFVRNPQVRYTIPFGEGAKLAFSAEAPNAAIDTGKASPIAANLGVQGRTQFPDFIAKYAMDRKWGHAELAGMLRSVGYESANTPDNEPSGAKTGWGFNLNGWVNLGAKDRITATLIVGEGIASYMNDGGVDLAPSASFQAELVQSVGWVVYYDKYWDDRWSSSFGASQHRQSNTDGQLDNSFKTGTYGNANLLYKPARNVTVGVEALYGKLELKDGSSNDDVRVQTSAIFRF
ncbi:MAG TPA: DcaP family trimeric outer membrane transporter [Burkholderiales bacterium]|nr:DcaP family trimeric outer membrane transporter [Burkholderiales bacterium]